MRLLGPEMEPDWSKVTAWIPVKLRSVLLAIQYSLQSTVYSFNK